MRADAERLQDSLDAIGAIQAKVGEDRSDFDANPMLRVWCLHHATIIGEAVQPPFGRATLPDSTGAGQEAAAGRRPGP